jgi:SAM-dependent methyltransferase
MLAYQSFILGNQVIGVSIKDEVRRNQKLFNDYLGISDDRLQFRDVNLYKIETLDLSFDEIICTEVMEHIKGDAQVCESFFRILKPGGILHICCPNAEHPHHRAYPLDPEESGGHVRPGYTYETYKQMLEPIGFALSPPLGLGGPVRQACNKCITKAQEVGGLALGLPLFALLGPLSVLDQSTPKMPYSLYVRATKPAIPEC